MVNKVEAEFEIDGLEKCPYCHTAPVIWIRPKHFEHPYWIGCPNTSEPFSDCHYRSGKTLWEAIETWNEDVEQTLKEMENNG